MYEDSIPHNNYEAIAEIREISNNIKAFQNDPLNHPLTCGVSSSHELLRVKDETGLICPSCGWEQPMDHVPAIAKDHGLSIAEHHEEIAREWQQISIPNLLHVEGSTMYHGDVVITGSKKGLQVLIDTIMDAMDKGKYDNRFFPSDGEYYDVTVKMDDSDWQGESWQSRETPYHTRGIK